jgi:hypothetical protein
VRCAKSAAKDVSTELFAPTEHEKSMKLLVAIAAGNLRRVDIKEAFQSLDRHKKQSIISSSHVTYPGDGALNHVPSAVNITEIRHDICEPLPG